VLKLFVNFYRVVSSTNIQFVIQRSALVCEQTTS